MLESVLFMAMLYRQNTMQHQFSGGRGAQSLKGMVMSRSRKTGRGRWLLLQVKHCTHAKGRIWMWRGRARRQEKMPRRGRERVSWADGPVRQVHAWRPWPNSLWILQVQPRVYKRCSKHYQIAHRPSPLLQHLKTGWENPHLWRIFFWWVCNHPSHSNASWFKPDPKGSLSACEWEWSSPNQTESGQLLRDTASRKCQILKQPGEKLQVVVRPGRCQGRWMHGE